MRPVPDCERSHPAGSSESPKGRMPQAPTEVVIRTNLNSYGACRAFFPESPLLNFPGTDSSGQGSARDQE